MICVYESHAVITASMYESRTEITTSMFREPRLLDAFASDVCI